MKTSSPSLRAPAETPKRGFFERFTAVILFLLQPIIGCNHTRISLPYNNLQTCLDCGMRRLHLFADDFPNGQAGIYTGPWHRDIRPQDAHRVVAKTLMDDAIRVNPYAPGKVMLLPWNQRIEVAEPTTDFPQTLLKCLDCGDELNPFGICPHASTETIKLSRSPIHCGKVAAFPQGDCRHTTPTGAECKECGATLNADGTCPANLRRGYSRLDVMA